MQILDSHPKDSAVLGQRQNLTLGVINATFFRVYKGLGHTQSNAAAAGMGTWKLSGQ